MPNRYIKESICASDTLALLAAEEERLFYRLIVKCDDFGRYDARPQVLRAECFPLQVDVISAQSVAQWLARLVEVDLIEVYEVDGRQYLHFLTWDSHQNRRAKESKWPAPEDGTPVAADYIRNQMQADAGTCARTRTRTRTRTTNSNSDAGTSVEDALQAYAPEFEEFWAAYPRKDEKRKAYRVWTSRRREGTSLASMLQAATNYAAMCRARAREPDKIKLAATFLGPDRPFEEWINRRQDETPRSLGAIIDSLE